MTLRVGAAVVDVDVPVGTPMGGYAGRLGASSGEHDPTTVRAVVLDDVAIVTVDVCVLHEDTCRSIEVASGLQAVVTAAIHTHSGPAIGRGRAGAHDERVHQAVISAAIEALRRAREDQRPAEVAWTSVRGLDVARDRRHLERRIDPPLTGLAFRDTRSGRLLATIASYPCHPVVLDATNTLISADYIHPLRARVEQTTAAPCLFLTGAAGDVNTGHAAAASFGSGTAPDRTFERAAEVGRRLAQGLLDAEWEPLGPIPEARFVSTPVALGFEPLSAGSVATRRAQWMAQLSAADPGQRAVLLTWIGWADRWRAEPLTTGWTGRVGRLKLGEAASLLTLPGEPFLAVADHLMVRAPRVMVAGYCDGVPGYLPTRDAWPEGGYEVEDARMYYSMPAPFEQGSAERVRDLAGELLDI